MYGKIFDSIYDSTVADDWRALITFQQFIVLCDSAGTVDMTPQAIARRTNIPIEHIKAGIEILESPDPYSRTEGQDGVRIERIDSHRPWGWSIVNHSQYRDLASREEKKKRDRERIAEKRLQANENADVAKCRGESLDVASVANVAHADADADTDKTLAPTVLVDASASTCPYQKIVEKYHEHFPAGPKVKQITEKRKRAMKARWLNGADDMDFWDAYFKHASTSRFLTGNNDRNWVADLDAHPESWPTGKQGFLCKVCLVHAGFAAAYGELRENIFAATGGLGCKSFVVTGHSLGAGLGPLLTYELRARGALRDRHPARPSSP